MLRWLCLAGYVESCIKGKSSIPGHPRTLIDESVKEPKCIVIIVLKEPDVSFTPSMKEPLSALTSPTT